MICEMLKCNRSLTELNLDCDEKKGKTERKKRNVKNE